MRMSNLNRSGGMLFARPGRITCLFASALLALFCASAQAHDKKSALDSLEDSLAASAWKMSPASASVLVGGDVELDVTFLAYEWASGDSAVPERIVRRSYPDLVKKWQVNGIDGGNSSVGTVTKGSNGKWYFHAPATVPATNPVSVAATLKAISMEELQLVSNIQVVPSGWSGSISVEFQSNYNNSATFYTETATEADANIYFRNGAWYEVQRIDTIGREIESVSFRASYAINGTMVESFAEDGTGLAILQLAIPSALFSYDRIESPGLSQGCRTSLGNSTITEVDGGPDLASYASMPPSPVIFNINPDGTSSISAIPPALMSISGRKIIFACDGNVGWDTIGPMMEAYGDTALLNGGVSVRGRQKALTVVNPMNGASKSVGAAETAFALNGVFRGLKGQRQVYKGDVTVPGVFNAMGSRTAGEYRIRWNIRSGRK